MYRTPDASARRFSFDAVRGRVARGVATLAWLLVAMNLAAAAWLLFDHYGFVVRALSRGFRFLPEQVVIALIPWAALPFTLANLVRARGQARRNASPTVDRSLTRHGLPADVAREVEREVNDGAEDVGEVIVTAHWIVHEHPLGVHLIHVEEIAWVFGRDTDHRVNGLSVARSRGVEVHTRAAPFHEIPVTLPCGGEDRARLLALLAARAPWCLMGHSPELAARWDTDRAGVLAEVDGRRGALTARTASE